MAEARKQKAAKAVAVRSSTTACVRLCAAAGATAIGYVLADRTFLIPFTWNPWVWVLGVAGGAIGVAVAGWLGTRATLRQPPLAVLRQLN